MSSPSPRAAIGLLAAFGALVLVMLVVAGWDPMPGFGQSEDDIPVSRTDPEARRAIAAAQQVVRGEVVGVWRDDDDGAWEVAVRVGDAVYEVELEPDSAELLGIDYD